MSDKTLVFEVTLNVEPEIIDELEIYMVDTHIPEVIATLCFTDAWFGREGYEFRVSYQTTRGNFERYLRDHAAGLRQDFAERFPTGIELRRRNWDVIRSFRA